MEKISKPKRIRKNSDIANRSPIKPKIHRAEQPEIPSIFARLGSLILFLAMTITSLAWSAWTIYSITNKIISPSDIVIFDKGSIYLLGVSIALAALTFAIFYEAILRREPTERYTTIFTRTAIVGLTLTFLLPHLFHYFVDINMTENGYSECSEASYYSSRYSSITYTNSQLACIGFLEEKKNRWKK